MANTLNVGEYGENILIDLSEDVSTNTNTIVVKDPAGNEATYTATAGGTNKTDSIIGPVVSGEYIEWTITSGTFDESGRWSIRAVSTSDTKLRKTNWLQVVVKA